MKNLKQYLEEKSNTNLTSGIRYVESALSYLYKIAEYLKQDNSGNRGISSDRQLEYVQKCLLKSVGYFGLQEYTGNPVEGNLKEAVNLAITSISKILTAYNDGLDDPIGWGKICADTMSTLIEAKR